MKFGYTLLYVADVTATLEFYESVFGFQRKFFHEDGDQAYGELVSGETTLGFVSEPLADSHGLDYRKARPEQSAPPFELAFLSEDVPTDYEQAVEKGAIPVSPPATKPWGQVVSYVRDNNGFLIEICSPMGG